MRGIAPCQDGGSKPPPYGYSRANAVIPLSVSTLAGE